MKKVTLAAVLLASGLMTGCGNSGEDVVFPDTPTNSPSPNPTITPTPPAPPPPGTLDRSRFSLLVPPARDRDVEVGALASADFNKDGRNDLVQLKDQGQLEVLLLEQYGDWVKRQIDVPGILMLTAGDVNGDGNADIVGVSYAGEDATGVFLAGDGTGNFAAPVNFSMSGSNYHGGLRLADMNGDGRLDLVFSALSAGNLVVGVSLGNDSGLATSTLTTVANEFPYPLSLAVGDLNGDGNLDVVTAVAQDGGGNRNIIAVVTGDGEGGLSDAASYRLNPEDPDKSPQAIDLADLDGDGKLDVVTSVAGEATIGGVFVYYDPFGTPRQQFSPSNDGAGSATRGIATGDLNGDSRPDVAFLTDNGSSVGVFLTQADGSLVSAGAATTIGGEVRQILLADLNADGRLDLGAANNDGYLSRLNGLGNGLLLPTAFGADKTSVVEGDVNGDGRPDLVVAALGESYSAGYPEDVRAIDVQVFLREQDGSLPTSPNFDTEIREPGFFGELFLANVDEDPDLELVATFKHDQQAVSIVPVLDNINGTGEFSAEFSAVSMPDSYDQIAVGDLNGDGLADIVADSGNGNLQIRLSGVAEAVTVEAANLAGNVRIADIDGDGDNDLIFAAGESGVGLLLNSGDGTSYQGSSQAVEGVRVFNVAAGDLNGDGRVDIVGGGGDENKGTYVFTLLNQGNAAFALGTSAAYPALFGIVEIKIGDLNGDGMADFFATSNDVNGCAVFTGLGDGVRFNTGSLIHTGDTVQNPGSMVLTDADGDGNKELLFATAGGVVWPSFLTLALMLGWRLGRDRRNRASAAL